MQAVIVLGQINVQPDWIVAGGATSVLLWVVFALMTGRLHTDGDFQDERADKLFYREMALRGTSAAEQMGQVAKDAVTNGDTERIARIIRDELRRSGR